MTNFSTRMRERARQRERRLATAAAAVLSKMRAGDLLQFEFTASGPRWCLATQPVRPEVAMRVVTDAHVVGDGDTLFPEINNPQSWRWADRHESHEQEL